MSTIEYMSFSKPKRALYKFGNFFSNFGKSFVNFFRKIPKKVKKLNEKILFPFKEIGRCFKDGDIFTKLSFLFLGIGQIRNKQIIRGVFLFLFEIVAILFFIYIGLPNLIKLPSFGYTALTQYPTLESPFIGYQRGDDSFMILLNSVFTLVILVVFVFLWYTSLRDSLKLQQLRYLSKSPTDKDTIKNLSNKSYDKVLLAIPTLGIALFTIIPMFFMILIAFTNYNSNHMQPKELIDWIGLGNFQQLLGMGAGSNGSQFAGVFLQILLWTLIWAFFATFTNYFIGMIVAIIINKKGIKLKKLWRTILITTIAVPQFISLLLMSKMLNTNTGVINNLLLNWGWISSPIRFLEDGLIAKITIIVVNMWIGVPYTMLMCTGILMNIPEDLYESAKIDGASPYKMYMKITLPYMLFVTTPYLISQFVGNINNFNVIYLLSGGGPMFTNVNGEMITARIFGAGQTDLLITWLYKMSMGQTFKDYGASSVIGLVVFVIVAFFSLIFYSRSNSIQNEEDFQ